MNFSLCILLQIINNWEYICQVSEVQSINIIILDTTAKLGIPSLVPNRTDDVTYNFKNIGT